jgi:hypothetical protein
MVDGFNFVQNKLNSWSGSSNFLLSSIFICSVIFMLAGNGLQVPEGRDFYHKT